MFSKLFCCLAVFAVLTLHAQHKENPGPSALQDSIDKGLAKIKQMQARIDSVDKAQLQKLADKTAASDSANMARGLDEYMAEKKEQDKRMVKQLWIKGSVFVFMLGATIVGFVRRRKQKVKG